MRDMMLREMSISAGTRIAPYQTYSRIAGGGTGDVNRAMPAYEEVAYRTTVTATMTA